LQTTKNKLIETYQKAREFFKEEFGETPEEYRIFLLADEDIYTAMSMIKRTAASPHAIPSSLYSYTVKEVKQKHGLPKDVELVVNGSPTLIFMSKSFVKEHDDNVLFLKIVHSLAHAFINERTKSRYPSQNSEIYKLDYLQKELFLNNVVALVKERDAVWAWQYFQDFTALLRIFALHNMAYFYTPPPTVKKNSVFYNYLIEAVKIAKKRGEVIRKIPLHELIVEGFAHYIHEKALEKVPVSQRQSVLTILKDIHMNPMGIIGSELLKIASIKNETTVLNLAKSYYSDLDLLNNFELKEIKTELERIRVKTSEEGIQYHSAPASYWTELWPLHALEFDKVENYSRQILRYQFKNYNQLLNRNPILRHHGYVKVKDRKIQIFTINNDEVGLNQHLILRNHLLEKRQDFITSLPGLPDIIVFKTSSSMSMAQYITVGYPRRQPKTPYDLPKETRAVIVSKSVSYKSELEETPPTLPEEIDYSELKDVTQPQRNAIRYLLRFTMSEIPEREFAEE